MPPQSRVQVGILLYCAELQLTGIIPVADLGYSRPKPSDQGQTARYYPTGRLGPSCLKSCFRYVKYNAINTNCSLSHGFVMVQKLKCCKIHDVRHVYALRSVAIVFLGAAIGPLITRSDCDRCDQCDRRAAIGLVKFHDVCVRTL